MKSFFTGKSVIESINCNKCGLDKSCKSPTMKYTGFGKKKLLIIGEAPGRSEDEDWKELGYKEPTQFIGQAGELLESKLSDLDLDLREDCWIDNSLCCRPPSNRTPKDSELKYCTTNTDKTIEKLKPDFIWLLGGCAVKQFYQGRFSDKSITRWRHLCIPDKATNAWVMPLYHPSYILRNRGDSNLTTTWDRDLKWAVSCLNRKSPIFENYEDQVEIVLDYKTALKRLREIFSKKPIIAFDYETTNLKPFGQPNWIWSVSFASEYGCFSLPISYQHWEDEQRNKIVSLIKMILSDGKIKKVAHNLKFEDMWSRVIWKIVVKGWLWCTQTNAHIIDPRKGYSPLKFQSYVHFGVGDYGKDVDRFIKTDIKLGRNRLDEVSIEKLLLYGGIDSLNTFKLYNEVQLPFFNRNRKMMQVVRLFKEGNKSFSKTQIIGIGIDEIYYMEAEQELKEKIKVIEDKLLNGKEVKLFKKHTGRDLELKKDFPAKDLRIILFDVLEEKSIKQTKIAKEKSVDEEALIAMKNPFAKLVIKRRKLYKILNTYIAQFRREVTDGRIHPFTDLTTTQSGRGSMSRPSFQNIPVRDEIAKKYIRRGIIPSSSRKIMCADYRGVEVRIAACETKDTVLVDYIKTGFDMHKEQAKYLFNLTDKQVEDKIRFYVKNQFVFPEFYGSYYGNCARNLKDNCFDLETGDSILVKRHLQNVGIIGRQKRYWLDEFTEHVKEVEKGFWNKFYMFREWQGKCQETYRKKGYVESLFGFRRGGYLNTNKVLNTPIQSAAFHCLLWSYNRLMRIGEKRKWATKLIGQIHDEIIKDLFPREQEEVVETTIQVMTKDIQKFEWLIVPMEVEVEMTEVDQSWYYKKEIEI